MPYDGDMLLDTRLVGLTQVGGIERLLKQRAGVVQLDVAVPILEMADIAERKDRLAAIAFAAHDGGDGARGRHGGLGSIAQAILLDAAHDRRPVELRPLPVTRVRL